MFTHRPTFKTAALLLLAGAVVGAPSFAFADRDHGKPRGERHERRDRDDRHGDRDDRGDRYGRRDHEVRWERHHDRDRRERDVRVVEVRRAPAPHWTIAVQFGRPSCPPAPVCYAPPQPVYYSPAPVCASNGPACGAYYDPYCDVRYTSFELYLEHVSRNHGISVAIRN